MSGRPIAKVATRDIRRSYIVRRSVHVHFREYGPEQGSPVMLISGTALPGASWLTIPHGLARNYRVIVPDNRSTGASDAQWGPFSTNMFADDCAAILNKLSLKRAWIVGHSQGGMAAMKLAIRYPKRVAGLGLLATSRCFWLDTPASASAVLAMAASFFVSPEVARIDRYLVTTRTLEETPELLRTWRETLMARRHSSRRIRTIRAFKAMIGHLSSGASHYVSLAALRRISAPTIIVHGTKDRIIPAQHARVLRDQIPHAKLAFVNGGHAFLLEKNLRLTDEDGRLLEANFEGARVVEHIIAQLCAERN